MSFFFLLGIENSQKTKQNKHTPVAKSFKTLSNSEEEEGETDSVNKDDKCIYYTDNINDWVAINLAGHLNSKTMEKAKENHSIIFLENSWQFKESVGSYDCLHPKVTWHLKKEILQLSLGVYHLEW